MIWLPVWLRGHYTLTCGDQPLSVLFTGPFYWSFLLVLLPLRERCYAVNGSLSLLLSSRFIICIANTSPSCHLFQFLNSSLHFNVCLPFFIVSTPVQILSILLQKLRRNPFQILSSLSLLLIPSTLAACPLGHLIMKRWVGRAITTYLSPFCACATF